MIIPMYKYTFMLYHREYNEFLKDLRLLGIVHVVEKDIPVPDEFKERYKEISHLEKTIQFLERREIDPSHKTTTENASTVLQDISDKQKELETLGQELEETKKALEKAEPWGDFSIKTLQNLKEANIHVRFFISSKKKYLELCDSGLCAEIISESADNVHFVLIQEGESNIELDAEEVEMQQHTASILNDRINKIENDIYIINTIFNDYAQGSIKVLEKRKNELVETNEFESVVLNTAVEAEAKLMVLEGWVPNTKKVNTDSFLEKNNILFISNKPTPEDNIPILLKNNRYSKLFEPIGSMFSLPAYYELDLTVFFAPFFMLFFGFCLGDAGYGLLFVIGGGLYKLKAKKEFKPYLSLIQFLGIATILFGAISGTLFGINLIEANIQWIENYRSLFFDPNKMFNLSLVLGIIQIIFGLFLKAANQIKQYGLSYALSTFGWLIILLGSILYTLLLVTKVIPENKKFIYALLVAGGFFILFFSDPRANIFTRLGKGVWDVYSTVTGIFGDLLSYIRLFALGLSSAILGFVINDIALQILGASKILGPIFFVIFLLLGHTLNILISSLGSFVHPMRLTFVEFYKNAGFKGGGEEYKPFSKYN